MTDPDRVVAVVLCSLALLTLAGTYLVWGLARAAGRTPPAPPDPIEVASRFHADADAGRIDYVREVAQLRADLVRFERTGRTS